MQKKKNIKVYKKNTKKKIDSLFIKLSEQFTCDVFLLNKFLNLKISELIKLIFCAFGIFFLNKFEIFLFKVSIFNFSKSSGLTILIRSSCFLSISITFLIPESFLSFNIFLISEFFCSISIFFCCFELFRFFRFLQPELIIIF